MEAKVTQKLEKSNAMAENLEDLKDRYKNLEEKVNDLSNGAMAPHKDSKKHQ